MDKFQALESFYTEVLQPMGVSRSIVEDADLIVGAQIKKSATRLNFDVRDISAKYPYELRLKPNDIFLAVGLVATLAKIEEKAGDWATNEFTYIEKNVFVGAVSGQTEVAALRAIFGGTLNMERDRVALIKDLKMKNLQYVPYRQIPDGVEPTTNWNKATYYFSRRPIICGDDQTDFMVDMGTISTALKNVIEGNFNAAGTDLNAAGTTAWQNHLKLHFVGFRVPGVAAKYKAFRDSRK